MRPTIYIVAGLLAAAIGLALLFAPQTPAPVAIAAEGPGEGPVGTIIVGQGDPSDPCTVEVAASVYPELQKAGIDEWPAACRAALDQQ